MIKSEISEIKKVLKSEDYAISEVWSTYVNMSKEVIFSSKNYYSNMSKEVREVYSSIFVKSLSGKQERNLLTLDFPIEEEQEGGKQLKLYNRLKDQTGDGIEDLINEIIENYNPKSNFAILIAKANYDVPKKTSDDLELGDSEEVYNFMVTAICPMDLDKPSLCYDRDENDFVENPRNWTIQMPEIGFLFPTFSNRQSNVHECMYYVKKANEVHLELMEGVLGCQLSLNAYEQKEKFNEIVESNLDDLSIGDLVELNKNINIFTEEMRRDGENTKLKNMQIENLLTSISNKEIDIEEDIEIMADNIAEKNYNILTAGTILIRTNHEGIELIKQRSIDGRDYLVIPMDEVELNGIKLKSKK